MLNYSWHKGNTLSEYAVVIGLVAFACIGSLSLFGNSTASLVSQVSQGADHERMMDMSLLNFGNQAQAGAYNGNTNIKAAAIKQQNANVPGTATLLNTSSDGVNATSVDGSSGKIQTVQNTLSAAKAMQAKAANLPEGALKQWYLAAARETLLLAGNEASLSYSMDNIKELQPLVEPNMTPGDALYEISNHFSMLGSFLLSLPPNITETEKTAALSSVNDVLNALTHEYAEPLSKYTNMAINNGQPSMTINAANLYADKIIYGQQNYTKTPEDLQKIAPTALSNGTLDRTPAVQTSLETGLASTAAAQ